MKPDHLMRTVIKRFVGSVHFNKAQDRHLFGDLYEQILRDLRNFTKGTPTQEVWFYEHPYPPGVKSYNKTRPMRSEEFAAEKAWWNNRVDNEQAWKVSAADIKARNYNLHLRNPHSPDAVVHDPQTLLADYAALQVKIGATRAKLRGVLNAALHGGQ